MADHNPCCSGDAISGYVSRLVIYLDAGHIRARHNTDNPRATTSLDSSRHNFCANTPVLATVTYLTKRPEVRPCIPSPESRKDRLDAVPNCLHHIDSLAGSCSTIRSPHVHPDTRTIYKRVGRAFCDLVGYLGAPHRNHRRSRGYGVCFLHPL